MILRKYQRRAVANCVTALKKHGNTLLVSATGSGKTVILSAIVAAMGGRAIIVQHRDVLISQNSATFCKMYPKKRVSFVDSSRKSFAGKITFGMVQTLSKAATLAKMKPVDLIVYDEAHHSASNSYRKITEKAKTLNPNVMILGVTATPERSDTKGLKSTFDNVAEIITIGELVRGGYLVPPRGLVIDIGTQKALTSVKKTDTDYNMAEVEVIQNSRVLNKKIIEHWENEAIKRPTVAFCSTIKHAEDVTAAFRAAGQTAETMHSKMSRKDKKQTLIDFDAGKTSVLTNPMMLTEGWDCQVCSCVMLLRPSSHKSTMVQMVGRGLRKVDPARYPGVIKKDCKVLDFGISLLMHGNLDSDVKIRFDREKKEEMAKKSCPSCYAELPLNAQVCAICGYEFKVEVSADDGSFDELEEFRLVEIDLINNSPFRFLSIFPSEKVLIASGFGCWAAVINARADDWYAIGGEYRKELTALSISNKIGAISSADDFMRAKSSSASAKKAAKWMCEPASEKQIRLLSNLKCAGQGISKVVAAAMITFKLNQGKIEELIGV